MPKRIPAHDTITSKGTYPNDSDRCLFCAEWK